MLEPHIYNACPQIPLSLLLFWRIFGQPLKTKPCLIYLSFRSCVALSLTKFSTCLKSCCALFLLPHLPPGGRAMLRDCSLQSPLPKKCPVEIISDKGHLKCITGKFEHGGTQSKLGNSTGNPRLWYTKTVTLSQSSFEWRISFWQFCCFSF